MIRRMNTIVYASALGFAAAHCGGGSTPESNTAAQASQDQSETTGAAPSDSDSSGAASGSDMSSSDDTSSASDTSDTSSADMSSASGASSPSGSAATGGSAAAGSGSATSGSEWTSSQRMPVSGRDEGNVGSEGSRNNAAMPMTDAQIAGVIDFANNAEIQQAQLAQSKSKDAHVASFASMMIEQHSKAKQEMTALGLSSAGSSVLQTMSGEGQRTMATLRDKSGRDFDRAYLQAQVEQHQKLLDTIDRQLMPNAKNTGLRSQLSSLRPTVQQHLQHARDALRALESNQSSNAPRGTNSNGSSSSGTNSSGNSSGSNSSGQRTGTGRATEP